MRAVQDVIRVAFAAVLAYAVVIGVPKFFFELYFRDRLVKPARSAEAPCPQRIVAVILKCDASGCDVRVTDGTLGRAKLPVELGKLQEVCPL